jgi:hypothetical protein
MSVINKIEYYDNSDSKCINYTEYKVSYCEINKEIEVKLIDSCYNHHFIIIDINDGFVINYLKNDIVKLWNFIKENDEKKTIMFKLDKFGKYMMVINEPVYLEYHLKSIEKEKQDLRVNKLIHENKRLEQQLTNTKEELEEFKKSELINHFETFIYLDSYDRNSTDLKVTMHNRKNQPSLSTITHNLNSLILFPLLKKLHIDFSSNQSDYLKYQSINDFLEPLGKLKLESLKFSNSCYAIHLDFNFISKCKTLKEINLESIYLKNVDGLYNSEFLEKVIITKCPQYPVLSPYFSKSLFKNPSKLDIIIT